MLNALITRPVFNISALIPAQMVYLVVKVLSALQQGTEQSVSVQLVGEVTPLLSASPVSFLSPLYKS